MNLIRDVITIAKKKKRCDQKIKINEKHIYVNMKYLYIFLYIFFITSLPCFSYLLSFLFLQKSCVYEI